MKKTYKFLNFYLDTQQQAIFKGKNKLDIASTGYKILLYLVQNPAKTIARDELIENIWQNKFVSDATLYKQIQRLRNALFDNEESKNIIRTVHGIGFIFLPKVSIITPINNKKNRLTNKFIIVSIIFIALMIISVVLKNNYPKDMSGISQAQAQLFTIAMIPNFTKPNKTNQTWMTSGGAQYLNETFKSDNIKIKRLKSSELKDKNAEYIAIELNNEEQVDAALLITVNQENGIYLVNTDIRNANGIVDSKTFADSSLKLVLDKVTLWSKQTLNIDISKNISNTNISKSSFAVENYIRAMAAQFSGDIVTAIKYFEIATLDDQNFWLAWYELSIAYRKQGQYDKALSIINTLENMPDSHKLTLLVQNSKIITLWRLGNLNLAINAADICIQMAKEKNSIRFQTSALTNKAIIAKQLGDLTLAESSINTAISMLLTDPATKPSSLGSAYNTMAGILINKHELDKAIEYAEKAKDKFTQAGYKRQIVSTQSRLAQIYLIKGQLKKAKKLFENTLQSRIDLSDNVGKINSLLMINTIQMIEGYFKEANITQNRISDLLDTTNNKYLNFSFFAARANLSLLTHDLKLAKMYINKLQNNHLNKSQLLTYYLLGLRLSELENNQPLSEIIYAQIRLDKEFNKSARAALWEAKIALKQNNLELAGIAFEKAYEFAKQQVDSQILSIILNTYIEFLLNKDLNKAHMMISELQLYNPAPYPFLKTKAQYLYKKGQHIAAVSLLQELKLKAAQHWAVTDQLLLEKYQVF